MVDKATLKVGDRVKIWITGAAGEWEATVDSVQPSTAHHPGPWLHCPAFSDVILLKGDDYIVREVLK